MQKDARFADADEMPLRLMAQGAEDLPVLSSLLQDAVLRVGDIEFDRRKRRLVMLINRFRWEDAAAAEREKRPFERVRAVLVIEDVLGLRALAIREAKKDAVLSLMALQWTGAPEGDLAQAAGQLALRFGGGEAIEITLDGIEITLSDVTRPHQAHARTRPAHPLEE